MSSLKVTSDLAILGLELKRWNQFLDTQGWRQFFIKNMLVPGFIKNPYIDVDFLNSQVVIEDLVNFKIKIQKIEAIDSDANYINLRDSLSITIPQQNLWYWIKVSYASTAIEKGTFVLDTQGNLTGTNSELLSILRGGSDFPSRVKFLNATLNTNKYDVITVIDDTHAKIFGSQFQSESNLQLSVVGTFTPGVAKQPSDEYPFQYDSCIVQLVQETSLNAAPPKVTGKEFYIARVQARIEGGSNYVVEIQDKRSEIFLDNDIFKLISSLQNEVTGVEYIKYQNDFSNKEKNDVYVAWGIRSNVWSVNTTLNEIFLSQGKGGSIKQIGSVSQNQFTGWRLYSPKGKYSTIRSVTQSGGGLKIKLDSLLIDNFSPDGGATLYNDYVVIVPDSEAIEFIFTNGNGEEFSYEFPINEKFGICDVAINSDTLTPYIVHYRYKNVDEYTIKKLIPDDLTNGYYNENQFDYTSGQLIGSPAFTTYQNGIINLITASNGSFSTALIALFSGLKEPVLLSGYDITPSGSNSILISSGVAFIDGKVVKTQQFSGTYPVWLKSNGQFVTIDPGGVNVKFDPYSSQNYDDVMKRHTTKPYELVKLEQADTLYFDPTGMGRWKWKGFARANGQNGTVDRTKFFELGASLTESGFKVGDTGGSATKTIGKANLPNYALAISQAPHKHSITASSQNNTAGAGAVPGVDASGTEPGGNTNEATIDITVNLDGGGQAMDVLNPYKPVVILMRLP